MGNGRSRRIFTGSGLLRLHNTTVKPKGIWIHNCQFFFYIRKSLYFAVLWRRSKFIRLRLRLSNFNIKYSLKNKVKYFYFFKCVRNLPIISTTLCKSCYNLTKIIRIVAPLPPQNPRSQCILTSSGSSKQVRLRLHNNESTIKQKNMS